MRKNSSPALLSDIAIGINSSPRGKHWWCGVKAAGNGWLMWYWCRGWEAWDWQWHILGDFAKKMILVAERVKTASSHCKIFPFSIIYHFLKYAQDCLSLFCKLLLTYLILVLPSDSCEMSINLHLICSLGQCSVVGYFILVTGLFDFTNSYKF